jgi:hypothetical protein
MAQQRVRTAGQQRGRLPSERNRHHRPDCVHGRIDADQAAGGDQPPDRGVADARGAKLTAGDVAALKLGDARNTLVAAARDAYR